MTPEGSDERSTWLRDLRLIRWLEADGGPTSPFQNGMVAVWIAAVVTTVAVVSLLRGRFDWTLTLAAVICAAFWLLVAFGLRREDLRFGRRTALALTVAALLVAVALLPRIEELLEALFVAGDDSFGMSQGPFELDGLTGGPEQARKAVATWSRFTEQVPALPNGAVTPGSVIALWWLLIDTALLAPAYGVFAVRWIVSDQGPLRSRLNGGGRAGELRAALRWIRRAVIALVAVDLLENTLSALTIGAADQGWGFLGLTANGLRVLLLAKWALALLALLPGVLLLLPKGRELAGDRPLGHGLIMSRFQLLAIATMTIFGLTFADQLEDVILDAGWWRLLLIVAAALLLGLVMAVTSRGLIQVDMARSGDGFSDTDRIRIFATSGAAVVALAVAWAVFGDEAPRGLVVAGGLVAAIWLMSWRIGKSASTGRLADEGSAISHVLETVNPSERPEHPSLRVPGFIAGAPLLLLGYWVVQASTKIAIFEPREVSGEHSSKLIAGVVLIMGGSLLILAIWELAAQRWARAESVPTARESIWWGYRQDSLIEHAILGYAVTLVLAAYAWGDPVNHAREIGVFVVLFASLAVLTGLGTILILLADWVSDRLSPRGENAPPEVFRMAGLNRIPVVVLLLAWLAINQLAFGSETHFDIRTVAYDGDSHPLTLETALARWTTSRSASLDCPARDGGELVAVPFIVVSSEGGGIRAAYWAASTLDELFSGSHVEFDGPQDCPAIPRWEHVFALSGISGGSVGMAGYMQEHAQRTITGTSNWERARFAGKWEFLSPPMSWLLVPELVGWHFLRMDVASRIEFHERALEAAWGHENAESQPALLRLLADTDSGAIGPVAIFNAATSGEGCILNVGPLLLSTTSPKDGCLNLSAGPIDLAGGLDLRSLICPSEDLSIFTAAMASARFPVVSPSAHYQCGKGPEATAIDGGAVDAGAALTPLLIWPDLLDAITAWNETNDGACIVPIHIQIDNGGESPIQAKEPFSGGQIKAFTSAQSAGTASRSDRFRAELEDLFDDPYEFTRNGVSYAAMLGDEPFRGYARVFPEAEPSSQAPLGWFLSKVSTELMDRQLEKLKSNGGTISVVGSWFNGELTCAPG